MNIKKNNLEEIQRALNDLEKRVCKLEGMNQNFTDSDQKTNNESEPDYLSLVVSHKKAENRVFITAYKIEFKDKKEFFKASDINKTLSEYFRTEAPSNTPRGIKKLIEKKYIIRHKNGYRLSQVGINHFAKKFIEPYKTTGS